MDFFSKKLQAPTLPIKIPLHRRLFPVNFEKIFGIFSSECFSFFRPSQSSCSTSQKLFDSCIYAALSKQ